MGDEMSGVLNQFPLGDTDLIQSSSDIRKKIGFVCFIYFWFYLSNVCGVDSFIGNISTS